MGEWVLRLQSTDRSQILACVTVIGETLPRVRFELSRHEDQSECAIELISQERANSILDALKKFYQRRRGKVTYTLGHVNSANLESGVLVER
jgi:hypothetical protein